MMAVFCGVTALSGHLWPVYLDFKGGKGVATAAGILFALNWTAGAITFAVWLVLFLPLRYVSLASVAGAAALPFAHFFTRAPFWPGKSHWPVTIFCVIAALVVIFKHRENLGRLRKGEEKKFHFKKDPTVAAEPK